MCVALVDYNVQRAQLINMKTQLTLAFDIMDGPAWLVMKKNGRGTTAGKQIINRPLIRKRTQEERSSRDLPWPSEQSFVMSQVGDSPLQMCMMCASIPRSSPRSTVQTGRAGSVDPIVRLCGHAHLCGPPSTGAPDFTITL